MLSKTFLCVFGCGHFETTQPGPISVLANKGFGVQANATFPTLLSGSTVMGLHKVKVDQDHHNHQIRC